MNRRWIGPLALAGATIISSAALYLLLPAPRLWVRLPMGTLALVVGVLGAGIWAALIWHRHAARGAREEGWRAGSTAERDARRRFLARLDHELKNPVTAIRAAVASAGVMPGPPPHSPVPQADATHSPPVAPLAIVDAQSARLAGLVGDLRKLAEFETQPIEMEEVSLEAVAHDAVTDLTVELSTRGDSRPIALSFPRVPWPLPPVRGDVDLLYLAVYNLLSNAVKYSPEGSPIEVRGSDEHGMIVVDVADTGIGIPDDELPVVIDELARGREARGIPGSGLGLALVRVVAERHGGTLTLRSRHGEGTSARLWIPATERRQPRRERG